MSHRMGEVGWGRRRRVVRDWLVVHRMRGLTLLGTQVGWQEQDSCIQHHCGGESRQGL